jgi:exodeoxyribonuclease V alpha subunit
VIGHAAVISASEWVTASGEWVNDRTHGQQYKAKFLKTSEPTSLDGIEKYLGSGMIRGIGVNRRRTKALELTAAIPCDV